MQVRPWVTHVASGVLAAVVATVVVGHLRDRDHPDPRSTEQLRGRIEALEVALRSGRPAAAPAAPPAPGAVDAAGAVPLAAGTGKHGPASAAATAAPSATPSGAAEASSARQALLNLLREPDPALLGVLAKALDRVRAKEAEQALDQKAEAYRESSRKSIRQLLGSPESGLALSPAEVGRLEDIAIEIADRQFELWRTGGEKHLYLELELEQQQRFRQVLGDDRYLRSQEQAVRRTAYDALTWSVAQAGIDDEQRRQVDELIAAHVRRVSPAQARLASEVLADGERRRLAAEVQGAQEDTWRRFTEEVLTDEQRQRLPPTAPPKW